MITGTFFRRLLKLLLPLGKGKKGGYVGFGFAFLYLRKMMRWFVTLLMGKSYNRFFCIGAVCGGCRANVDEVEEGTKLKHGLVK